MGHQCVCLSRQPISTNNINNTLNRKIIKIIFFTLFTIFYILFFLNDFIIIFQMVINNQKISRIYSHFYFYTIFFFKSKNENLFYVFFNVVLGFSCEFIF